jgi:hypothetical protein
MNAVNKPALSVESSKLITEAGVAEGAAAKRWKIAADAMIADGITSAMLGTVAKPEGMDGKANADVTRSVVAAITASFTKAQQVLIGTAPDAIHVGALDLMAQHCGVTKAALEKMDKDQLKVQVRAVKNRRTELQVEQAARLNKVRRYLIAEERAEAEAAENGTPRGPKSDGQRIHEMLDRILKMLQKHGEKKDATWDVVAATVAVRALMKLIPKV